MPCIYTHESFGKQVAKHLPKELQIIIHRHQKEFRAGLQGPDFLFFYYPMVKLRTNQLGYRQHSQPFNEYLEQLLPILQKDGINSGVYAYTLGFVCHFMLDSECHSYVIPMSKKPGYNHLAIENEFDRYLMQKDGLKPIYHPVWKLIHNNADVISAIEKAYTPFGLSKKKIKEALYGMRFYKWLFTCGNTPRRFFIRLIMRLSMFYDELEGHMLNLRPKKYASKTNQSLMSIFQKTIPMTCEILQDFHLSVTENKPLNKRFYCTFKSNQAVS